MNLTQKISQMTPKGADLDATDLIEVSTIVGGSYVTKSITGQELIDAIPLPPTGLTVGTTPISSGTIGRVLFQGTGNVLQQSSSLFWDNTNAYLGIGTSAPTTGLELVGAGFKSYIKATALQAQYLINRTATATNIEFVASTHQINFNINNAEAMRLTTTRNVLINTTTDAGFKLDVNGSARALNSLVVYGDGISPATRATLTIQSLGETFSGRLVFSRNNSNWYNQIETIGSGGGVNLGLAINDSGTYSLVTNQGKVFIGNSLTIPTTSTLQVKGAGNTSATTSLLVQNSSSTELFRVRDNGNVGINTTTDAGFRLDVNGTARVQDTLTVVKNQNLGTSLNITNTTSNFLAGAVLTLTSDASSGNAQLGKYSTTTTAYKTLSPKDVWIYNSSTGGDISILNDFATGQIKFAAGGSSTAHMTIKSNGRINMSALPTSSAGLSTGDIWNDAGTLKIV